MEKNNINKVKPDKLNFITAGMPLSTGKGSYPKAFEILKELNLNGMELEFVHGVRLNDAASKAVSKAVSDGFIITAHGPFYINLNSVEPDKIEASKKRIIETAIAASSVGAYSITYHAAYYMKKDKEAVYKQVESTTAEILETLKELNIDIWIRPETTGKGTQWGDLDEVIRLSKVFDNVLPCIDFSHLHARYNGIYNTYDEFAAILDKIGTELGDFALKNFHGHLAGIEYTAKGERQHLILEESDMNYKDLLKALKDFGVKGALVCESPNIEDDCVLLKQYYESLQ